MTGTLGEDGEEAMGQCWREVDTEVEGISDMHETLNLQYCKSCS